MRLASFQSDDPSVLVDHPFSVDGFLEKILVSLQPIFVSFAVPSIGFDVHCILHITKFVLCASSLFQAFSGANPNSDGLG